MKKLVFLYSIMLFVCINVNGQNKQIKYKKTPSGLEYAIITGGKGKKVQSGYQVSINYTTRLKPDSIFDSNSGLKHPFSFILGQGEVLKGWDEGISLLNVGDSASFRIPPQLAYGEKKVGKIPANSTIFLEVKVLKANQAFYDLTKKDTTTIVKGLKKIKIQEGTGKSAVNFENVTIGYTGYYINEKKQRKIFESSSINDLPATFQLGTGRFLKGLDIGISGMKTGEKSTFIISPDLAFGTKGVGDIPANTIVIFDIELISSINPFYDGKGKDTIRTPSGLRMVLINEGIGKKINKGNYVTWNYIGYIKDSVGNKIIFDNTYTRKKPVSFRSSSNRTLKGWGEAALMLNQGSKATLALSPELAYKEKEMKNIPKNATVYFDVDVVSITEPFYDVSGKDTIKKPSGLKYIIVSGEKGSIADTGKVVSLSYVGYLIDSVNEREIFDASIERGQPFEFQLGKGKVIPGWDEGITGMVLGEKRRLIIPANLGYGQQGVPSIIPPNSILYFDIELMEVKNPPQK